MIKVLIIDEDLDFVILLKTCLERKGYTAKFTLEKQTVHKIIKKYKPHLIIIDILQIDFLQPKAVRDKLNSTPVIVLTGYTSKNVNSIPVHDTLVKPFEFPLLEKKIRDLTYAIQVK